MTETNMTETQDTRLTKSQSSYDSYNPPVGVDLRDYFAAHAIGQLITDKSVLGAAEDTGQPISMVVASIAYDIADAMLKVRGVKL